MAYYGFLEDSNSPSTEKHMEDLKGYVRQKWFWPPGELETEYFLSGYSEMAEFAV